MLPDGTFSCEWLRMRRAVQRGECTSKHQMLSFPPGECTGHLQTLNCAYFPNSPLNAQVSEYTLKHVRTSATWPPTAEMILFSFRRWKTCHNNPQNPTDVLPPTTLNAAELESTVSSCLRSASVCRVPLRRRDFPPPRACMLTNYCVDAVHVAQRAIVLSRHV